LDLYIVGSRYEGGPQSIIEAALTETPIISTNVGIASTILSPASIYRSPQDKVAPDTSIASKNVQKYLMKTHFEQYTNFFKEIIR